jgi:hypothetical protein
MQTLTLKTPSHPGVVIRIGDDGQVFMEVVKLPPAEYADAMSIINQIVSGASGILIPPGYTLNFFDPPPTLTPEQLAALHADAQEWARRTFQLTIPRSEDHPF